MSKTVNCSIIGQKSRGGNTYGSVAVYLGHNGTYYEYTMAFTTGDFKGISNSITFNIRLKNSAYADGTTKNFRYALLTSDENVTGNKAATNYYYETIKDVEDPNQIAKGIVSFPNMRLETDKVITINTDALQPNTTYYLVIWPYQTNVFCTVSSISSHGAIIVDYEPIFTVIVDHKIQNKDGSLTQFDEETYTIDAGTLYTPELRSPPSTNTTEGATFKAWKTDWSLIAEGVVGVDYVTVNEDLFVSVYYPLVEETGSYIHFKVNGQLIECEVLRITDGDPVLQELFYKDNGQIIEI